MDRRLKILVTNDDGIDSPGIRELIKSLKEFSDVFVLAPDRQQSAISHAMTIAVPLLPRPFSLDGELLGYALNGTPVDCVKLAVSTLMDEKPDLICSGINLGPNTSVSVNYSGTIQGIPSIAISLNSFSYEQDFKPAANYTSQIIGMLSKSELPSDLLLNVNIPSLKYDDIKGIKITHLSNSKWKDAYQKRTDPFGRDYYWFDGEYIKFDENSNSDDNALNDGFISVTPLEVNYNNFNNVDKLKKVLITK